MSASTATAERRAIRRAVGHELVAFASDTTQAVKLIQASLQSLEHRLTDAEACCQERWDAQAATNTRGGDRHQAFVSRPFWQRLRWLVTGR